MARPVNVQTTMVSMNVWVIETSACRTGSFVCAAAAAIPGRTQARLVGEDPAGDSKSDSLPHSGTCEASHGCRTAECTLENQGQRAGNLTGELDQDQTRTQHVGDDHERHKGARELADRLDPTEDHQPGGYSQDETGNPFLVTERSL